MYDLAVFAPWVNNAAGCVSHMQPASACLLLAAIEELNSREKWCDGVNELNDTQWDTVQAWIDGAAKDAIGRNMIGAIVAMCRETFPPGILLCDGATYDKDDYPLLYDALPSGMKTANDFTLPDLRAMFVRGGDVTDIGDTGGEDTHTLTVGELASHRHGVYIGGDLDVEGVGVPQPNAAQLSPIVLTYTAYEGDGDPHENRPAYYTLAYGIIAW